ncbi:hypothetical protein GOP47_0024930 [Adiantum capillus-veneris]|uniref:GDSL esterase/lipase n=1 Tax=Adiantum capillus-veneris TaxID=13818 RepID=A0A9D4U3R3_ADICA|nr:hypothetical protein GOP47_0024930 [Adiantum capillus-veneris]
MGGGLTVKVVVIALLLQGVVGIMTPRRRVRCRAPLVVFGASMMDVGENAAAHPFSSASEFPPYGLDYFKAPAARYSNGRVISDFISIGLGYGLMDAYLNSVNPRFTNGVNFASSGSTARNSTQSSSAFFSLDIQVRQYRLFQMKVQSVQTRHRGRFIYLPTPLRLSRAIHVIMQAHNDYGNTILGQASYDPLTTVTSVIAAFESSLRELYNMGARTMIVMNVLPLGCTPGYLTNGARRSKALDEDSCVAEFNSLVDLHNSHLQLLINHLREELVWKELVVFDLNAVYIDAVRHPSKYGVKYPMQACCGVGGKYNVSEILCGNTGVLNGKEVQAWRCANPTEYISWDGLHPTESFAKHIAAALLSGKYFSPSLSISDACL